MRLIWHDDEHDVNLGAYLRISVLPLCFQRAGRVWGILGTFGWGERDGVHLLTLFQYPDLVDRLDLGIYLFLYERK